MTKRSVVNRRGVTMMETVLSVVTGTGVLACTIAMSSSLGEAAGIAVSQANLIQINQAHELFAADRDGRMFATHRDDYGEYGNSCTEYLQSGNCPDQVLLGNSGGCDTGCSGGLWGYWVDWNGTCSGFGSCGNWVLHQPMDFNTKVGGSRLPNIMRLNEYLTGRFYDPLFYAPLDTRTYERAAPMLEGCCGFEYNGVIAWSSYSFSSAAMYDPGVLRANADGGFQMPGSYDESHKIPQLTDAQYPSLKTLLFEHNWNHGQPGPFNPLFAGENTPYYFNHGRDAMPLTCFFDGSVRMLPSGIAEEDDARVIEQTGGVDGLWHRNTPMGFEGYYNTYGADDIDVAHNVLTTGGIQGRDVLSTIVRDSDINGDDTVSGYDLNELLGAWGDDPYWSNPADLNADGKVDGADLTSMLGDWSN